MDGGVLDGPISETKEVVIEQRHGTITEQAWDGWVLVQLATDEAEDSFAHQFANDEAKRDEKKLGVWVDLSTHSYYFPEMLSSFTKGRKRRKRQDAQGVPGLFGLTGSCLSMMRATPNSAARGPG